MRLQGRALWEDEKRAQSGSMQFALLIQSQPGLPRFCQIALYTSPWDAVQLRVPGDQGNWWHLLVGAPYFLAFR